MSTKLSALLALTAFTLAACGHEERPQNPTYNPADSTHTTTTTTSGSDILQAFINTAEAECESIVERRVEAENIPRENITYLENTTTTTETTITTSGLIDINEPTKIKFDCNFTLDGYDMTLDSFTYIGYPFSTP